MPKRSDSADDFPPDAISPDEAIDLVIDAVLLGSKRLRTMTKDVLKAQRRLRRFVDDRAWAAFMRVEEITNERHELQMQIVTRWALGTGARSRR